MQTHLATLHLLRGDTGVLLTLKTLDTITVVLARLVGLGLGVLLNCCISFCLA